eukprot:3369179-Prymnesium_polylepis.1
MLVGWPPATGFCSAEDYARTGRAAQTIADWITACHGGRSSPCRTPMAQCSAPRQALPRSDAREMRPHAARAHHRPSAQHSPRDKHARPVHCSANTAVCAQTKGPRTPNTGQ